MQLFIAEKRSVAEALASQMGNPMPGEGFYQVSGARVAWAMGHLLELAPPEKYESAWKRWRAETLPLLPDPLRTVPTKKQSKHLQALRKIIRDPDIKEIINACDAGREGELIFAWILEGEKVSIQKKYKHRLWLSSLTPGAIEEGLAQLRPAEDFHDLRAAAKARAEADWLLGINATRAATLSLRNLGVVSLGRVQTPTLALLVQREKEREAFQSETFWTVQALFRSAGGKYRGEHREGRMSKKRSEDICKKLGDGGIISKIEKKTVQKEPPLLYDLTALQRAASAAWNWPAKRTLSVAQELYEKEKVLSYPRTASRYLPEGMQENLPQLLGLLPKLECRDDLSRVFRDSGVTDHHALIPVANGDHLQGDKKRLFELVRLRSASALSPDAIWEALIIHTNCQEEEFLTRGKIYQQRGWQDWEAGDEKDLLPDLKEGEEVRIENSEAREGSTKPPPRFSDGTLLGAMETCGREVGDAEAREAMKESGLGTPATRAAIIERLLQVDYLQREGKTLQPTQKGIDVIEALRGSPLLLPELTGEWEKDLLRIEKGSDAEDFRRRLREWVCQQTESLLQMTAAGERDWGACPGCKQPLRENRAAISCWRRDDPGCGFALWKKVAGKKLSDKTLQELIEGKRVGPLKGFRSRGGKTFAAEIELVRTKKGWETKLLYGSEK